MGDAGLRAWLEALLTWTSDLGRPLFLGLIALAGILAPSGYLLTRLAWRYYLIRHWHQRRTRRA